MLVHTKWNQDSLFFGNPKLLLVPVPIFIFWWCRAFCKYFKNRPSTLPYLKSCFKTATKNSAHSWLLYFLSLYCTRILSCLSHFLNEAFPFAISNFVFFLKHHYVFFFFLTIQPQKNLEQSLKWRESYFVLYSIAPPLKSIEGNPGVITE